MSNPDNCWVGFDLGGTKMLACVFDDELEKIGSRRRKTRGEAGQEEGECRWRGNVRGSVGEYKVDTASVDPVRPEEPQCKRWNLLES